MDTVEIKMNSIDRLLIFLSFVLTWMMLLHLSQVR